MSLSCSCQKSPSMSKIFRLLTLTLFRRSTASQLTTSVSVQIVLLVCFCASSFSEVLPVRQSRVAPICSGWNPDSNSWGLIGTSNEYTSESYCPKNQAYVAIQFQGGPRRGAKHVGVSGTCCPIPDGVLLDRHVYVEDTCPENHLATGVKPPPPEEETLERLERTQLLRCTAIDSNRYQLGKTESGILIGWLLHFRTYFDKATSFSRLPLELRLGAGRFSKYGRSKLICLGHPWGAFLTGKQAKYCSDHTFSELQYRDTGKPVVSLGHCLAVDDPYSKSPACSLELQNKTVNEEAN